MPEQPILEVRGLTREFVRRGKPFPAVDDVNLTLDPGEFMAIVGRSGNGKSTLLNLVTGLLKPTSGSILLAGNEVTTLNDKQMSICATAPSASSRRSRHYCRTSPQSTMWSFPQCCIATRLGMKPKSMNGRMTHNHRNRRRLPSWSMAFPTSSNQLRRRRLLHLSPTI